LLLITPEDVLQGVAVPVSKPGLPSSWAAVHPPPPDGLIVQVNVALPD
jgi:hypothetical protein